MSRSSPYPSFVDRRPLDADGLQRALVTPDGLWTRVEVREETPSTNSDVAAAARAGEPEGLVVAAEWQTAGRGRLGRGWSSPPRAGLAVSVLLRPGAAVPRRGWPAVVPTAYGWLPLLAGVALVDAVRRTAGLPAHVAVEVKWPNDLLVGGAKCAGILAETVPADPAPAVVLGIGLNVTLRDDELPPRGTGLPATSLLLAGATVTDRDLLLRELLRALAHWYARWRATGGDARACGLREAYVERCATIGREVRVILPSPGAELVGVATGIDDDGRVVVRVDGEERSVAAGDILHLR